MVELTIYVPVQGLTRVERSIDLNPQPGLSTLTLSRGKESAFGRGSFHLVGPIHG